MAKLTDRDIASTKIISATFASGKWFVLVSDTDNVIYNVSFDGLQIDSNITISTNTYTALLDVDKYVEPTSPKEVVNDKVVGATPTAPKD
jgi:hypothetical protein